MNQPHVSPDGKFVWDGNSWVPVANAVSAQQPIQIQTFASNPTRSNNRAVLTFGSVMAIAIAVVIIGGSLAFFLIFYGSGDSMGDHITDFDGDGITDANDPDDDNDGYDDDVDWFDQGNGGLVIEFNRFSTWSEGNYDSGGPPDVYAYVGIGDGDCSGMEYFAYMDTIEENADELYNWHEYVANIDEDAIEICISVTLYDEDSWAPDEILDYVPGDANYHYHVFNLQSGEGDTRVTNDNRGENDLSVRLEYKIYRTAIVPA